MVFAALLSAVARNPSLRGQLFSYAILGFAFVEAIGVSNTLLVRLENIPTDDSTTVVRPDGCHDVQVRLSAGSTAGGGTAEAGVSLVTIWSADRQCAQQRRLLLLGSSHYSAGANTTSVYKKSERFLAASAIKKAFSFVALLLLF